MRKIFIRGTPPADWVIEADAVTASLRAASDAEERKRIIETHEFLWRDNRIRDWLFGQFNDKCWYTEARESVSAYHVDHFRPKGAIRDEDGEGYWWLAFEWTNYRISGQLINTKKGDVFPIVGGHRADAYDSDSLALEAPLLIDPCTDDARLVSYERVDNGCEAVVAASCDTGDERRAAETIDALGLNRLPRLNESRAQVWDRCMRSIAEYRAASCYPDALKKIYRENATNALRELIVYEAEFSSVAEACIRKNAPEPLAAAVFSA